MLEYTITKNESNQKIEKYIKKRLNNAPLSMIYKLFRKKDIKVNGVRVNKDYIVKENDKILIYLQDSSNVEKEKTVNKLKIDFKVLYEDENILVVDKPSGLLVHEDSNNHYNTLSNQVLYYLYNKNEYTLDDSFTPGPCHRLDRNTSGIVIFGKNNEALKELNLAFKERSNIKKYYLALVFGKLKEECEVECLLSKDEETGIVKVVKSNGLSSLSIVRPLKVSDKYSLVEVELKTGRTHQIRVHMSYINHPVVGDKKYGNFKENSNFEKQYRFENQFLHAYKITFENFTGLLQYLNKKEITSNLPKDKLDIINSIF